MLSSQEIDFFVTIAASKSLAAAARKLNVTPPSVSQRLQNIERKLGVILVERSARAIALTPEGEILALKGKVLLKDLEALHLDISNQNISISGKLRLLSPIGFGVKHIAPIVRQFQSHYPELSIELQLSDTPNWSARDNYDLMFYIGHMQDSSLKRVVLAKNRRLLLASPDYLKTSSNLTHPKDLDRHRCIALRENDEDATMWRFIDLKDNSDCSVRIEPVLASNVGQVVKEWCIAGCGVMQRSQWDVKAELQRGELVKVLSNYQLASADILALMSSGANSRPRKVSLFLEFVQQQLAIRL
ncbi:LysR family transcriptional regulator [Alginatibacterium sediminis]|uniref:LysR family transcriptional regulator n=1 Tax=Alginatibacterium sediminis TaxID=2164068 RepID=A0A420E9L4_9ALTE|nr:LysR family transcriptional regulator [Alginatibacterium sediminis]RKF17387.1 LysR family transcriptional regulator [Alginatibacterium sediminis]